MVDQAELESIIQRALPDAEIVKVTFKEDTNREGDPIVRIAIVYRGGGQLDARRMSNTLGGLWEALVTGGDSASPVVTFVASEDYEDAAAA